MKQKVPNTHGVYQDDKTKEYISQIGQKELGRFDSLEKAKKVYNEQAKKIFNFPLLNKEENEQSS